MSHMVEHHPKHEADGWPWLVWDRPGPSSGREPIRCTTERAATRVAQALDLLDAHSGNYQGEPRIFSRAVPLPEGEIMIRAREAAIAVIGGGEVTKAAVREGLMDGHSDIVTAARALRDLSKPLSEIMPKPVDPDLIEARKLLAETAGKPNRDDPLAQRCEENRARVLRGDADKSDEMKTILAAIRRGRELALKEWHQS